MPPSGRKKPKLGNGAGAIGDKQLPWRNFRNQDLLNTDFVELDPINKSDIEGDKHPTQIDFEYTATKPVVVGPLTKFFIEGRFDVKDTDAGNWRQAKAEDVAEVVLQYNWFEMLIKSVDVFHNNQRISSSNEQRFIAPYLNTMLYRYMHADTKRYLCPQMAHPSHCVPAIRGKWAKDSDAWKEYAVHVFNNDVFHFDFYPLFQFPFYIGSNFMGDSALRLVPLDRLGKLHVRFTFFDTQKHIFRKTDAAKSYRFVFKKFKMCLEEARLSPAFERQLHSKTKIEFPGVTRLQLVDPVPDSSSTHKTVFQDIYLPEAIFIFCLDKQIASGTYNFSDNQEQNVFKDHRIRHLDFSFDNKKFHLKEPHFGGFAMTAWLLNYLPTITASPHLEFAQMLKSSTWQPLEKAERVLRFLTFTFRCAAILPTGNVWCLPWTTVRAFLANLIWKLPFNLSVKIPSPVRSTFSTPSTLTWPTFWIREVNISLLLI